MLRQVFRRFADGGIQRSFQVLCAGPAPVVGPDVDGHVVHAGNGVDAANQVPVLLTAHPALVTGGKQVIGVQFFDEAGGLREPADEAVLDGFIVRETTGLVADLPGENGRIFLVRLAGEAVGAPHDGPYVIKEELLGFRGGLELTHLLHERPIAVYQRDEGLFTSAPLQVLAIAAAPLPGVVQEKNRLHVPFAQFH